jgi:hypothetical protein
MDERDLLAERFEANRTHLRAVGYRMLGSLGEADDAVQEAWLRLSGADTSRVENLEGWLTTVVARVCLDMLRSRKSRREQPFGVHVPDPIVDLEDGSDPAPSRRRRPPVGRVEGDARGSSGGRGSAHLCAAGPDRTTGPRQRSGGIRRRSTRPSDLSRGFHRQTRQDRRDRHPRRPRTPTPDRPLAARHMTNGPATPRTCCSASTFQNTAPTSIEPLPPLGAPSAAPDVTIVMIRMNATLLVGERAILLRFWRVYRRQFAVRPPLRG